MTYALLAFAFVALASTAAAWIAAYRARGESRAALEGVNKAKELEHDANRRAELAESDRAAAFAELKSAQAALARAHATLQTERHDKSILLEKLAKAGAPIGPVLVGSAMDRLHANRNEDRRKADDDHEGDRGREMRDLSPIDTLK
jgi:hypothetical protein